MNEIVLFSITSLVIILMIMARFWPQIKSRKNKKPPAPKTKAAIEKAPEKPKADTKNFRWSYAVIAALSVATIYLLATGKTETKVRYVQQEQTAPAPEQYITPAPPTPEPPAAKSTLIGKWRMRSSEANIVINVRDEKPFEATGSFDGKVIILTETSRDADETIVGKWECTGPEWHQWGTFSIKFHGDVATGFLFTTLDGKDPLSAEKI